MAKVATIDPQEIANRLIAASKGETWGVCLTCDFETKRALDHAREKIRKEMEKRGFPKNSVGVMSPGFFFNPTGPFIMGNPNTIEIPF